ncbi:FecR family protein [Sphingomonas tagetis]|uniref:FecR family protein n=1 Tax=Sphingomonas tagetis TaxID=2949092 RepID=UPI0026601867|nr:FecR family protein [Sphingomonas tagetis]
MPVAICILLPVGAGLAVAASQVVGIAATIVNDVRIKGAAGPQARPAVARQRIALGDQVQTGARSRLQALLLDKSVFTVGADARLTIDRFVYDPKGGSFSASVAKGAFRFMSGRRGGTGSSINTPVATIGIRGTILDGVVGQTAIDIARGEPRLGPRIDGDPNSASLVVLRGPGARTQGGVRVGAVSVTAANQTVQLDRPMLATYVPRPGAPPMAPFTISLRGLARLNDMILPPSDRPRPESATPTYVPPAPSSRPPRGYRPPPGAFGGSQPPVPGGGFPGSQYVPSLPRLPAQRAPQTQQAPQRGTAAQPAPAAAAPAPAVQQAPARAPAPAAQQAPTPAPTPTQQQAPTPAPTPTTQQAPTPVAPATNLQSPTPPRPAPSPTPSPTPTKSPNQPSPNQPKP